MDVGMATDDIISKVQSVKLSTCCLKFSVE